MGPHSLTFDKLYNAYPTSTYEGETRFNCQDFSKNSTDSRPIPTADANTYNDDVDLRKARQIKYQNRLNEIFKKNIKGNKYSQIEDKITLKHQNNNLNLELLLQRSSILTVLTFEEPINKLEDTDSNAKSLDVVPLKTTETEAKSEPCIIRTKEINKLITELKLCTKELSVKPYPKSAKRVLMAAYDIKIQGYQFNEEEKTIIGQLVKDCFGAIDRCVFFSGYSFDIDYAPLILILRSGVQIILDDYKDFPTGCQETLEKIFKNSKIHKSITTLDKSITSWKEDIDILSYHSALHTEEELTRHKMLPEEHTWWVYPVQIKAGL